MLVSEIITLARRWTFTDANQYTDANALIDFNVVYRRTIALISEAVNQELYADYFWADLVKGQSEYTKPQTINGVTPKFGLTNLLSISVNYTAPTAWVGTVSISSGSTQVVWVGTTFTTSFVVGNNINIGAYTYKVISIESNTGLTVDIGSPVTYTNTTYQIHPQDWKKLRPKRASDLERDQDWYRTNQSKDDPFFIMFDTGIFIYPVATSAVPFGYRCYATKSTYNLALTDTPILDENWQQVLVLGLRKYIYTQRGLLTEASAADADYEKEISKMVDIIGDLQNYPFFRETPDLIQYQ